ncbi:MAG TPA: hypothetical protein VJ963_01305 [Bacteroidales bacterium]|nr:hypothetical protein [Bacteroidales bacterium]
MRLTINRKLRSHFFLILFLGHFISFTFFPHTHIVDGVTIVHSHPFRSHSGDTPVHHQHSQTGYVVIHFLSHIIAITSAIIAGVFIASKAGRYLTIPKDENIYISFFWCCSCLLRAPPGRIQK